MNSGVIGMLFKKLLLIFMLGSFSLPSRSQEVELVGSTENVFAYQLGNGLKVVLAPSEGNDVYLNVVYRVGSLADPENMSGTAHLLEHLMFKGTKKYPGDNWLNSYREKVLSFNATTSFDRTRYSSKMNSENLDAVLALEAERMSNIHFEQAGLVLERDVVSREFELSQENSLTVLTQHLFATATPEKGFGRKVLGEPEELEQISLENIQAFYDRYYHPEHAFVLITGGFEKEKALASIEQHFSGIVSSGLPGGDIFELPNVDGPISVEVRQGNMQGVMLGYPLPPALDNINWSLSLLPDIYAGEPHGYLYQKLMVTGAAQGVFVIPQLFVQGGYLLFGAIASPDKSLDMLAEELLTAVEDSVNQAITEESLQRALRVERQTLRQVTSNAEWLAGYLSEGVVLGSWPELLPDWGAIPERTLEEVQSQAGSFLTAENRVIGILREGEKKEAKTAKPVVSHGEWRSGRFEVPLSADVDFEGINQELGNIESHIENSSLSNGMRVAVLSRDNNQTVHGVMSINYGDIESLKGKHAIINILGTQLIRGTQSASYQEIVDRINELEGWLSIFPDGGKLIVRFGVAQNNIESFLMLLADILKTPALSQEEFDFVKRQQLNAARTIDKGPVHTAHSVLRNYTDLMLAENDIRRRLLPEDMQAALEVVSLNDVREFHKKMYGAGHGQLVIVGNVDAEELIEKVNVLFSGWNSQAEYEYIARHYTQVGLKVIHAAAESVSTGHYLKRFYFPLSLDSEDAAPLLLATYILGKDPLASRLSRRLREKEGMTYEAKASVYIPFHGNNGQVTIQSHYPIAEKERFLEMVKDVTERFIEEGVTVEELEWSKSQLLQGVVPTLNDDNKLAKVIHRQLDRGITLTQMIEHRERLAAVTVDQVNEVIGRYFRSESVEVIAE